MKNGFYLSRSQKDKEKCLSLMGIEKGSVEKRFNFSLQNAEQPDGVLQILITEPIGWWDTEKDYFARMLRHYKDATELQFLIATPGGFVDDMKAMITFTAMHGAERKVGYIMGDTASAGAVFANSLSEVYIAPMSNFMHHEVWGGVMGNAKDMLDYAQDLEQETQTIIDSIVNSDRFKAKGKTEEELRDYMSKDKFLCAKEAVAWGFVDGIIDPSTITISNSAELKDKHSFLNVFLSDIPTQEVTKDKEEEKVLDLASSLKEQFNKLINR